jgi:hypothetical protein
MHAAPGRAGDRLRRRTPTGIDFGGSRWRMLLGARYTF